MMGNGLIRMEFLTNLMFKQTLTLNTAGRILFAAPCAIFGLFHFMLADAMAAMVSIPGGAFWVFLTGIAMIAASVSMIIKKKSALASLLLGVLLIMYALTVLLPMVIGGDQMAMGQGLKDLALAGVAFYFSSRAED